MREVEAVRAAELASEVKRIREQAEQDRQKEVAALVATTSAEATAEIAAAKKAMAEESAAALKALHMPR